MSITSPSGKDVTTTAPQADSSLPVWFNDRRQQAWASWLETPAPSRKDETWRFGDIKMLDLAGFSAGSASDNAGTDVPSLLKRSRLLENCAARFVFVNETLVQAESSLPEGVIVSTLADAIRNHPELVERHFMRQETKLGSAKFAALHAANASSGLFVFVPDNVEVKLPVEVVHWLDGENTIIFPHTLVVCGAHASVTVVDRFLSTGAAPGWLIGVNDLIAAPGARLKYAAFQQLNAHSRSILINGTTVDRDADVKNLLVNTGGAWARQETLSRLEGAGANSDMLAVSVAAGEQSFDQRTYQHHAAPNAKSDLLYKNTLYGKSRTVFSGLIFVDHGAHYTDAYQTCRNMMMSADAEANSMPGLQINADQVKCSHGSTTAPISDEEIFYLEARGIHPETARQLIARGFSVEVFERFSDDQVEQAALAALDAKFRHIPSR